jgi:AcrR family transcriptional regulator
MAYTDRVGKSETQTQRRRTSRQREAGAVTRAETRRRILGAAIEVFTESGYAAATVAKIADRADVSVQSLYSAWGNKRGLLRGMMESQVLGDLPGSLDPDNLPLALLATFELDGAEPTELIAHLAHQFRLLAERAAVGWHTYAQAAAVDPEAAHDWQGLMEIRRINFRQMIGHIPADRLRSGLTPDCAADTAWVIASPQAHELMIRNAGFTYDEFEQWVRDTVIAALLPDTQKPSNI